VSDQQSVRQQGPTPTRNPWVTALLILIGVILLLPGLCSVILTGIMLTNGGPGSDTEFLPVLIICFLIGVGGVALIVFAIRRKRSL
jgi:hypothetical protein